MRLRFGKYKGRKFDEVPESYLYWLLNVSRELIAELEEELDVDPAPTNGHRHSASPNDLPPLTKELVETGFRALSKRYHPDLNGGRPNEKMVELNAAMAKLRKVLK
jgi:hypothetical protein